MPLVERGREIKRRRERKKKVQAIRVRLEKERDVKVRQRLLVRLKKIAPAAQAPEK